MAPLRHAAQVWMLPLSIAKALYEWFKSEKIYFRAESKVSPSFGPSG